MNKICTSLEQSKKLIELGIDVYTADMYWKNGVSDKYIQCFTWCAYPFVGTGTDIDYDYDIPCWSLAALLNVLPKHIKNDNVLRIDIDEKDFSIWYDEIGCGVNTELPDITMENLVDACYEMILKLHELNLL